MAGSIKKVAQLAGVSVATVSHVINDTRFVSEETRAKVLSAIEELQYTPNILARKFKTGSLDTVGFVVPDIANGYFATLIEEVEDVLQSNGFRLIVANTRENPIREIDSLRMLSSGVVDGLLLVSTLNDGREILGALPPAFPVVLVDRRVEEGLFDTVTTNNTQALHDGVSSLIQRGHRRIGFLASIRHLTTTGQRVHAYKATLEEHGLTPHDELICYIESITDSARPSAEKLIDRGCTAIVASNNVLTNQLVAESRTHLWQGRDIEILGYRDPTHLDIPYLGNEWIEEPVGEMGRRAAEAMVRRLANPDGEVRAIDLTATFSAVDSGQRSQR